MTCIGMFQVRFFFKDFLQGLSQGFSSRIFSRIFFIPLHKICENSSILNNFERLPPLKIYENSLILDNFETFENIRNWNTTMLWLLLQVQLIVARHILHPLVHGYIVICNLSSKPSVLSSYCLCKTLFMSNYLPKHYSFPPMVIRLVTKHTIW